MYGSVGIQGVQDPCRWCSPMKAMGSSPEYRWLPRQGHWSNQHGHPTGSRCVHRRMWWSGLLSSLACRLPGDEWQSLDSGKAPDTLVPLDLLIQEQRTLPSSQSQGLRVLWMVWWLGGWGGFLAPWLLQSCPEDLSFRGLRHWPPGGLLEVLSSLHALQRKQIIVIKI